MLWWIYTHETKEGKGKVLTKYGVIITTLFT